ncbi:MAG: phosphonate C-P lyase system protein PhnH [Bacteroidota bacterium]
MIRETSYNEVFDSQKHFRLIMDSMARPGKLNQLNGVAIHPPKGLNKAAAFVGLALLNADVSYYTSSNPEAVSDYFITNTDSQQRSATEADFLFLKGNDNPQALEEAKVGSLSYPETSAFIIIEVEEISKEPVSGAVVLVLKGPGVKEEEVVFVKGIREELLTTIQDKNTEYPLGVDTILTDAHDNILCLPRSNLFLFKSMSQ